MSFRGGNDSGLPINTFGMNDNPIHIFHPNNYRFILTKHDPASIRHDQMMTQIDKHDYLLVEHF